MWFLRLFVLLLVGILGNLQYKLWYGDDNMDAVAILKSTVSEQQRLNTSLEKRNRSLKTEIYDLKHGLDTIEEYARHNMGKIHPDETYFQIISSKK
jgi:cell division protein FtsB